MKVNRLAPWRVNRLSTFGGQKRPANLLTFTLLLAPVKMRFSKNVANLLSFKKGKKGGQTNSSPVCIYIYVYRYRPLPLSLVSSSINDPLSPSLNLCMYLLLFSILSPSLLFSLLVAVSVSLCLHFSLSLSHRLQSQKVSNGIWQREREREGKREHIQKSLSYWL